MSDDRPRLTREERLAAQLRANLGRRKAQARAQAAGDRAAGATDPPDAPAAPLSKPRPPG